MQSSHPTVRKMTLMDMPGLMQLKDQENWNQIPEDWLFLINHKGNVNLVLELNNMIIGTVTGMSYENKVAWIGMMLIDKNYRGKGLSKLLLNAVITGLKQCESIKLDATPAGQFVYKKIGFVEEYKVLRLTNPMIKLNCLNTGLKARQVFSSDFKKIVKFDEAVFGVNRSAMLKYLLENSPELAQVIEVENKIIGFNLGRKGQNYTQIGPVCASSEQAAKTLITSALNQLIGKAVVIDILADKKIIKTYLKQIGFSVQRPLERMYLWNNLFSGIIINQYGIAGLELG